MPQLSRPATARLLAGLILVVGAGLYGAACTQDIAVHTSVERGITRGFPAWGALALG